MGLFDDLVDEPAKGIFSDIVDEPTKGMFADIVDATPDELARMQTVSRDVPGADESPIGFGEAFIEDPLEKLPFSPMAAAEIGALITAGKRLTEDRYDLAAERVTTGAQVARGGFFPGYAKVPEITPESLRISDTKLLTDYFEDLAEKERRGYSTMGRVGQITSMMPAFMLEFLATGGAAKLGTKGAQKIGEKILKESAKKGLGKFAVGLSKFAASAGTRALAMPHRGAEAILKRQLPKGITFDELGDVHITKPDEKVWTSIYKGALDHYIEIASEQAGEYAGPLVNKMGGYAGLLLNKISPKLNFFGKLTGALQNAWLGKNPTKKAADFLKAFGTKTGFHGVLTEIGEEDLGWIARAILDVEDYGAGKDASMGDRLKAGLAQDIANLPAELIAFSIPGVARGVVAGQFKSPTDVYNVVKVDTETGEVEKIVSNHPDPLSAYRAAKEMTDPRDRVLGVEYEIREPGEAPETSRYGKSTEKADAFYKNAGKAKAQRMLRDVSHEGIGLELIKPFVIKTTDAEGNVELGEDSYVTRGEAELFRQGAEQEGLTAEVIKLPEEPTPVLQKEPTLSDAPLFVENPDGTFDNYPGPLKGAETIAEQTKQSREKVYQTYKDLVNTNKRAMSKEKAAGLADGLSKNLSKENPDIKLSQGWFTTLSPAWFKDVSKKTKKAVVKGAKVYHHSMSRVFQALKHLDGGFIGPLVTSIYQPIKTAAVKSHASRHNLQKEILDFFVNHNLNITKMLKATETIVEGEKTFRVSSLQKVQIYLNTKNEDNLRHLQNTLSQENIDKLSELNEDEQKVADWLLEQYANGYEEYAEIYRKATGKELSLVDDYVHIDVDKEYIDFQNDIEEEQVTRKAFKLRDVEKGATRERVKSDAPLRLNDALSAYGLHEANRRHYVAMELNAKDVRDIINNPKLAQRLNATTGTNYKKTLNKWLEDTATQSNQEVNNWFNHFMNGMRRNYVTYALGFNLVTVMRQPISFSLACAKEPLILINLHKAFRGELLPYGEKYVEFDPMVKSKILKSRFMERELREMEVLQKPAQAFSKTRELFKWKTENDVENLIKAAVSHPMQTLKEESLRDWSFRMVRFTDRATVKILFRCAYAAGRQRGMDNDAAIEYADSIITTTQPMAGIEDLPDIYRGGTFAKIFTTFQNQINQNYNFWAYDVVGARKRISLNELTWRVFMGHIVPAFIMGMVSRGFRPPDKKELVKDQFGYLILPLYFFGTIARNLIEGYGGRATLPLQVYDDIDDVRKGKTWRRKGKGAARAVGKGLGFPLGQAIRTAEGVFDWGEQRQKDYRRLVWSKYMLEKPEESGAGTLMRRKRRPSGKGRATGRPTGRTR